MKHFPVVTVLLMLAAVLGACGTAPQTTQTAAQAEVRIVTQVVTVVVTATPRPETPTPRATATPKATRTPRPTATPTPPPVGGKWQLTEDVSSFDDSKTVVLRLDAEQAIDGPFEAYIPSIILRCQEKQLEAYVNIGMSPDVEADNLDGATVRLRFDKDDARTENTDQSTDGEALFFQDAPAIIEEMVTHEQLLFGFTPFSANPAETTFDLRGLGEVVTPLRDTCK